jgi:hypothetical protein
MGDIQLSSLHHFEVTGSQAILAIMTSKRCISKDRSLMLNSCTEFGFSHSAATEIITEVKFD